MNQNLSRARAFASLVLGLTMGIYAGAEERLVTRQEAQPSAQTSTGGSAQPDTTGTNDDQWHVGFLPYLWFAGMHGTTGG